MANPINVNPQNYNFTVAEFKDVYQQAKESNGYIYINKQGQLAVRGFWSNFFGIGGIKNSKQHTMDALNRALQNSVDRGIDIFTNHNETTIKKGYGLSAGMMENTLHYVEKFKANQAYEAEKSRAREALNNKVENLTDTVVSNLNHNNGIKFTNNLKNLLLNKLCKEPFVKDCDDNYRYDLLLNTMRAINDELSEEEIHSINENGQSRKLNRIKLDEGDRFSVETKFLLGIGHTKEKNDILLEIKNQYIESHP